jgi:antiviral helicase SKI2
VVRGYRVHTAHVGMAEEANTQNLPDLSNIQAKDARQLLASIGLDAIPSREHIYREIEQRLLLPEERLPDHWLSKYQL